MRCNVAEYVNGWRFNGLYDGEKWLIYLKPFFMRSTNEASKQTNTRTHARTHLNAIGENAIMHFA